MSIGTFQYKRFCILFARLIQRQSDRNILEEVDFQLPIMHWGLTDVKKGQVTCDKNWILTCLPEPSKGIRVKEIKALDISLN